MNLKVYRFILFIGLTGILILASCNRKPGTEVVVSKTIAPEQTQSMPTASLKSMVAVTSYPGPGVDLEMPTPTNSAYPGPVNTSLPTQASPMMTPYPGPGEQPPTPPIIPTETPGGAYPAPGADIPTPSPLPNNPYPAPGSNSPTATQGPSPTAQTPISRLPTSTPIPPTPTGPKPTVSLELFATDPASVKLVSGKVQLVEFFAFWCGICRAMAPTVNELKAEYSERINFIFLDIDDPVTATFRQTLHFRGEPQFFLLDENGKVLRQWQDYVTAEQFRQAFDAALK